MKNIQSIVAEARDRLSKIIPEQYLVIDIKRLKYTDEETYDIEVGDTSITSLDGNRLTTTVSGNTITSIGPSTFAVQYNPTPGSIVKGVIEWQTDVR